MIGIASLILDSFENKRKVDWGLIFYGTVQKMVSVFGGTKPSSLTPFLYHLYKTAECLDQEEEAYYKATRVAEAYGFKDSEEDSPSSDSEESGPGADPSEPTPPAEVTPESAKTKRKQTPKAAGSTWKKRTNAKGEGDGFDLREQMIKDIKGMATLMSGQLAMAKEGYEYMLDIFHQAL